MKTTKIIYWVTTSVICLFASTAIFMNSKMAIDGATHLGIPRWLGLEVSIGQLIGLLLLIIPAVPARLNYWFLIPAFTKYKQQKTSTFYFGKAVNTNFKNSSTDLSSIHLMTATKSCS